MKLKCKSVWRPMRMNKYLLAMTMRDVNKTKTSKFCAHKTFLDIYFLKINSYRFISSVKTFTLQLERFISHWILFSTLFFYRSLSGADTQYEFWVMTLFPCGWQPDMTRWLSPSANQKTDWGTFWPIRGQEVPPRCAPYQCDIFNTGNGELGDRRLLKL